MASLWLAQCSTILKFQYCVDIGEVWANMLHNVYAAFVGAYGWSDVAMTDPSGPEGNTVYMHLFVDALSLQPCNPTCKLTTLLQTKYGLTFSSFISAGRS